MTPIFFFLKSHLGKQKLGKQKLEKQKVYCYINKLSKVVVAKLSGLENRDCEKVVFPSQKFLFTANDECELEIHQQTDISIIKNTIPCSKLKVIEN